MGSRGRSRSGMAGWEWSVAESVRHTALPLGAARVVSDGLATRRPGPRAPLSGLESASQGPRAVSGASTTPSGRV